MLVTGDMPPHLLLLQLHFNKILYIPQIQIKIQCTKSLVTHQREWLCTNDHNLKEKCFNEFLIQKWEQFSKLLEMLCYTQNNENILPLWAYNSAKYLMVLHHNNNLAHYTYLLPIHMTITELVSWNTEHVRILAINHIHSSGEPINCSTYSSACIAIRLWAGRYRCQSPAKR